MGQAKLRGTKEERVAQAIKRETSKPKRETSKPKRKPKMPPRARGWLAALAALLAGDRR